MTFEAFAVGVAIGVVLVIAGVAMMLGAKRPGGRGGTDASS